MTLYEYYFLFGIIAMVFSMAFSVFMMIVMWRTKEGVKRVSKTIKEQGEQLSDSVTKLLGSGLGGLLGGGNDTKVLPINEDYLPGEAFITRPLSQCCDVKLYSERYYSRVGIPDIAVYCHKCKLVMDKDGVPTEKTLEQVLHAAEIMLEAEEGIK